MTSAREDIEFTSGGGATLRGWLYPQEERAPCVVLQHGFTGVKELDLDRYAERFQEAGLACLAYDHPGFGGSDAVTARRGSRPTPGSRSAGLRA